MVRKLHVDHVDRRLGADQIDLAQQGTGLANAAAVGGGDLLHPGQVGAGRRGRHGGGRHLAPAPNVVSEVSPRVLDVGQAATPILRQHTMPVDHRRVLQRLAERLALLGRTDGGRAQIGDELVAIHRISGAEEREVVARMIAHEGQVVVAARTPVRIVGTETNVVLDSLAALAEPGRLRGQRSEVRIPRSLIDPSGRSSDVNGNSSSTTTRTGPSSGGTFTSRRRRTSHRPGA